MIGTAGVIGPMNWALALPELVLAVVAMAALVVGVLRPGRSGETIATVMVLGGFVLAGFLAVEGVPGVGYTGGFVADGFSRFADVLILSAACLTTLLASDAGGRERLARFEFPVLLALSTLGMMVMVSAENLMVAYLGLEMQSFAIYILCAFARDQVRSSEAGLKYFVLGALASGLLLYGISLVYGFGGSMRFSMLAGAITGPGHASAGLLVGMVFVIVGLAFKLSIAPFHMWTPDVYEGAPSPVTAFMSTAPKVAPFVVLMRIMLGPFGHVLPDWQVLIEIVAIASMLVGSLAALSQTSLKRMMAYSSIGHMGYASMGLAAGTEAGVTGVLVYLLTYVFMNVGTFGCILAMRRRGVALERISDLAGIGRRDPRFAILLAIFMFSMAGVPPLAGFFGKLMVFLAAIQAGLWVMTGVGIATSAIAAFYYLRVVRVMWFDEGAEGFEPRPAVVGFVSSVAAGFTVLFILFVGPLLGGARLAAGALFG